MRYVIAGDLPTLIWTANLADIELHTSLSLADPIERPTMMVFDLDPGPPADVVQCCEVAVWLREIFGSLPGQTRAHGPLPDQAAEPGQVSRPEADLLRATRGGGQPPRRDRQRRRGAGVARAHPRPAAAQQLRVGRLGIGEHGRVQPSGGVRAQDGGGHVSKRRVDERFVPGGSSISAGERPAHRGSPTNRVRTPRCASVKRRTAGMMREGLRPSTDMSRKRTVPPVLPSLARIISRLPCGTATSAGSPAFRPSSRNEEITSRYWPVVS